LFEFQDSRSIGTDPGEFESTAQTNKHAIQQLFGSATFRNVFGTGLRTDVHVGRLNLNFGRRRLVARNLFRNTTNAFDGVHWNLGRDYQWRVRAFIVRPVERTFEGLDRTDDDELFWGTYYETRQIPWLSTNLYYYGLNDRKPDIQDQRQYSTLGFRLYALPKVAWFDYEAQTAWQVGTKAGNDHFAYFLHGQVGYTFDAAWLPRLLFQYDYASGTRSPTGSQSGTFDTLFGARRWEYTPTGIFGPFFRSNISSPGVRLSVTPVPRTRLSLKVRAWWLAQSRDEWVGSGLQDPTGRSGNVLGQDLELRATWKPMSFVIFDTGYDHFFKGSYIESLARVPGNPPATDSDYFYIQTEIRF
ncbi:MAG: alginate export family protein, partial [Nitrospiraceae bacterium]